MIYPSPNKVAQSIGLNVYPTPEELANQFIKPTPLLAKSNQIQPTPPLLPGNLFGGTQTSTPQTTQFGTEDVLKSFGQSVARGFASTGAALQNLPRQVIQTVKGQNAPIGQFTPQGILQKTLLGTDKPFGYGTEGAVFGLKEGGLPATFAGAAFGILDLVGGGGLKGVKGLTTALRTTEDIAEATRLMKNAGFVDDIVKDYAPLFAKSEDAKYIEQGLLSAEKLQKGTKTLQPLAQEARKADFQAQVIAGQDLVAELKGAGIKKSINPDGTITIFHGTSKANAEKILQGGRIDGETFFSPFKVGTKYGDSPLDVAKRKFGKEGTIMEIKVDASGINTAAAGS